MGDDTTDHSMTIRASIKGDLERTMLSIAIDYLPTIAGICHTWDCVLNGVVCATIQGNCRAITPCQHVEFCEGVNQLYFRYHSAPC